MKKGMNEEISVLHFLESAEAAALESRRLQRRLDGLCERREQLRPQKGPAARRLAKLIDEERARELAATEKELENYRRVEAFLERIPDGTHRTILRRKYLDVGRSWTEIHEKLAEDGLFYSERHIMRLHTQAVEAAQMLWNREREEGAGEKRR